MAIVKVPQLSWSETTEGLFPLPDRWQVEICNIASHDLPKLTPSQIQTAIANPIGTKPLQELAKGKKEVVIIFDDMSRITRTYEIVPHVLKELAYAGIADSHIRFVCGLGCHGALTRLDFVKKLGEDVLARFPVYNHNPFGNCVPVGTTKTYKTYVEVNEEVMRCDLKIAIGGTVPHPMSGFGGGGKMILPGVTSFTTTQHNHHLTFQDMARTRGKFGMGRFDENSMRIDIEESAELAGLDFIINVLFNKWGESVKIFTGALKLAYATSVEEGKKHYLTPRPIDKDIVIANSFIKANESYITVGIGSAAIGKKGGDLVILANEPCGQVVHYLQGSFGEKTFGPEYIPLTIRDNVRRLLIFTEYPDMAGQAYFPKSDRVLNFNRWTDVLKVLEADYRGDAQVAVFPNADIQFWDH